MKMRVRFAIPIFLLGAVAAQTITPKNDFSITLQRTACMGYCPEYKLTISGDGSVRYEGAWYVRVKGLRQSKIPVESVQKLVQKLRDEDFLRWEEEEMVCVDFPVTHVTATLDGQRKHVLEGCSTEGKVQELADEIDKMTGSKRWVGHVRTP